MAGLDAGQAGADDGDRGGGVQLFEYRAQPLSLLEFGDGIGEFGCPADGRRHCAGATDGVDDVVVVEFAAGRERHGARGGVDAGRGVDHQPDPLAEERAVVDARVVAGGHQLVQPDPLDELRPGVDQRDVEIAA